MAVTLLDQALSRITGNAGAPPYDPLSYSSPFARSGPGTTSSIFDTGAQGMSGVSSPTNIEAARQQYADAGAAYMANATGPPVFTTYDWHTPGKKGAGPVYQTQHYESSYTPTTPEAKAAFEAAQANYYSAIGQPPLAPVMSASEMAAKYGERDKAAGLAAVGK